MVLEIITRDNGIQDHCYHNWWTQAGVVASIMLNHYYFIGLSLHLLTIEALFIGEARIKLVSVHRHLDTVLLSKTSNCGDTFSSQKDYTRGLVRFSKLNFSITACTITTKLGNKDRINIEAIKNALNLWSLAHEATSLTTVPPTLPKKFVVL